MSDLHYISLADAVRLVRLGEVKPSELVEACLSRIEAHDGELHAYITPLADQARADAVVADEEIAKGHWRGLLHGIPIALKDIYDTAGILTSCHSRLFIDRIPNADCDAWERLSGAGAILLGKTATHEFASGGPSYDLPWPPARNPWHPDHTPAGSSSGSGAAVAAGMAYMAMGSDTGGSIRGPAGVCGIAGVKPSYGRVSRRGIFPLSWSQDHAGPLARTSEDCALVMQAVAGHDPQDPASVNAPVPDFLAALNRPIKGMRIGWCREWYEGQADANVEQAVASMAETLRSLGAEIVPIEMPPLADFHACGRVIILAESFAIHRRWIAEQPEMYGEFFRLRCRLGAFISADQYMDALRWRRELAGTMTDAMREVDLVLTANQYAPADTFVASQQDYHFFGKSSLTMPANMTGQPALTVRAGISDTGLPVGAQLIGHLFADTDVLRAGHQFERARPDLRRWPEL
jgi:aspartyl-tRNA(Asn)/glutamyl-tRNA(Gln) amidotransferase subunit A